MIKNNKQFDNNLEDVGSQLTSSSNVGKTVQRKCAGCGEIYNRISLIKITKEYKTNNIIINPTPNQFGRSTYLCYNHNCLNSALKKKRIQKSLRTNLSDEHIKKLYCVLN